MLLFSRKKIKDAMQTNELRPYEILTFSSETQFNTLTVILFLLKNYNSVTEKLCKNLRAHLVV